MLHDSGEIVFDHDNLVLTFPRGHTSRVMTAVTIIQLTIQLSVYFNKILIDISCFRAAAQRGSCRRLPQ